MNDGWRESYPKDVIGQHDEDPVYIHHTAEPFIEAFNEGGHNTTRVPVSAVARWLAQHRPDLFFAEVQDVAALNQQLKPAGFSVAKRAPYGICQYCQAELFPEYNVCETCADERGP